MLAVLALFALTISCVDPLQPIPVNQSAIPDDALVFSPRVLGITPATKKTPGDEDFDRGENKVTRLDVFVYKTTDGTVSFHKHYTIGNGNSAINTGVDYLLESNWRSNYNTEDTYRIYAIANINANKLEDPVLPESPSETELLNLTSESDATITGQYGYTCYDIVRLKNVEGTTPAAAGSLDHHISDKLFLMDGKIDSWQVDPNAARQYFTKEQDLSYPLSRAAAKFRVELDFSDEFKETLGTDDGTGLKFSSVLEYWPLEEGQTEEDLKPKTVQVITIGEIAQNSIGEIYADGVVTGGARAKFANIMKATYNIAPPAEPSATTTPTAEQLTSFREANLWDSQNFYEFSWRTSNGTYGTGENAIQLYKYPYIDTTYSYAFSWDASQAAEKAPALAVSIIYTTYIQKYNEDGSFNGQAETKSRETNYYRIPMVDIANTSSVERNYYYRVTAEINTMGTSTTEIEPTIVNLQYKVIPWPDAPDEKTEAQTVQLLYFVPEKEYRLRGDGTQFTDLQYFTPKSDPNNPSDGHYAATPVIQNIRVYYKDQDDQERILYTATGGGYSWKSDNTSNPDVSIEVFSNQNGGGRFRVSSKALASRAVKYIEFDSVVDFSYADGPTVTQHIVVTHFPLDNIQNILGSWSSRWDGQPYGGGGVRTVYYRKKFYKETRIGVQLTGGNAQREWAEGVGSDNADRMAAQSVVTAVNGYYASGGQNNTVTINRSDITRTNNRSILTVTGYIWNNTNNRRVTISGTRTDNNQGTATTTWNYTINNNNHDYVVSAVVNNPGTNNNSITVVLHKYQNYYRVEVQESSSYSPNGDDGTWTSYDRDEWEECTEEQYNATAAEYRKTETVTVPNYPSTGDWVVRGGGGGTTNMDYGGGRDGATTGQFYAKLYTGTQINRMNASGGNSGTHNSGGDNPHMYVIQISKAEDNVNLGRPRLDSNYQSQDNVVSPAFMIASQLGTIQTTFLIDNNLTQSALDAARHCGTYMEVADNGRRFVGWRLPSQAEIAYIIRYQSNQAVINAGVFATVLIAQYYFTLDGSRASTTQTNGLSMVRCVRDLTPEEVIELNNTGTITTATY